MRYLSDFTAIELIVLGHIDSARAAGWTDAAMLAHVEASPTAPDDYRAAVRFWLVDKGER